MKRISIITLILLSAISYVFGEGSKNLAPDSTGTTTGTNTIIAQLAHTQGNGNGGITGAFMSPSATADERLFVHVNQGETLYMGFRRIEDTFFGTVTFGDLNVILRENDGTFVTSFLILADQSSVSGGREDFAFQTNQAGVIESYAEALAGPDAVAGVSGYNAISYTNSSLGDQDFYVEVVQSTSGSGSVTTEGDADAIFVESRYDVWDFSVYDGTTEKPGRLFCKAWGFSASTFANDFSEEFQLYINIPSTVGGANSGFYVKELDLAGLEPFTTSVFANSIGADLGLTTDLNGDGTINFQDARRSQGSNIADLEYDIFINNPDIDLYPTTTLPTVSISDAVFYCNSSGTGGEAAITITANQSGTVALLLDLDGNPGYDDATEDVIIETTIDASSGSGSTTVRWDGLDGLSAAVASGTLINISGRFTSGPLHIPLWDPEQNLVGINMLDVRPQTSFDLIYWDDRSEVADLDSSPTVELSGTNTGQHTWTDPTGTGGGGGNGILVNTWSFGYFQANTQNVNFTFACDEDGDSVTGTADLDSDNDGIANSVEGDHLADADADNIPNYLDTDFAGYTDSNNDGVDDNFDSDLDGIPDALDVDSDNDGIPDMVENGLSDTDLDGTLDNGSGIADANGNGIDDTYDTACGPQSGNAVAQNGTGTNGANALGNVPGTFAEVANGTFLDFDLGVTVPSGNTIVLSLNDGAAAINATVDITQSPDDVTYTNVLAYTATTGSDNAPFGPTSVNYVLNADARYIRVQENSGANRPMDIHLLSYSFTACPVATALTIINTDGDGVGNYLDLDSDNDGIVDVIEAGGSADATTGQIASFTDSDGNGFNDTQESVALTIPDTDADGSLADILDIDSDNDGILDNIEAQDSENTITTAAGDTDGDGLLDVYDPNNGGTLLTPVDTDMDGTEDYLSADSDGDGVEDFVEGWDNDRDGFSDLDTDEDRLISDEANYNVDSDTDGLWDIFESSAAPTPNSDGAGKANWQDNDDDNDGILTSGEDINSNSNWTDDFTQGQGTAVVGTTTPDYLYRGDYDGDAIADSADADSDNDGILDSEEDNGETIDPSGDADGDGIANYIDASDATVTSGLSSTADSNSDGVYDVFDSDLDGVPDFLDLDSDNDGIWDAIEADGGSVPNGLDETTGQFTLQDPDNDGLMNFVDTDDVSAGGTSDLANADSDSDGIKDYLDIDSDGDGITDIIEAQTTAGFIALSNTDTDGDGIDDSFDPSNGGTKLDPVNTDGIDLQDYLDTDSDNDGVRDIIEGDDVDEDGYGDWDSDEDNDETDEAAFIAGDADGDGLSDLFDNVTLGSVGNETGSNADLQNTDAIDFKNWRDPDDDNDGNLTEDEDANSNGNFADDQTGGQAGDVPDFLFFNDFDLDLIADGSDGDSDNDGIPDASEAGGEAINPSADADGDGIPNYKDANDPGLVDPTDSNGDGVYDVYDSDLDGVPDFRDRDSDNDGVPDLIEAGGTDVDGDGVVDGLNDTDNDGIPDSVDVDQTAGTDSDGDGIDDAFDFSVSGGTDTDGDDIIDSADLDIDGDGIANIYDADNGGTPLAPADSDGDGFLDFYDLDSDDDGIPDLIEFGGTDANGDGKLDDLTDTDNDGFADLVDSDNGGTALTRPDSDNDGIRDYIDVDSDNDGITDTVENGGIDTNNDGKTDGFANDTDGDGLSDDVDPDNGGTTIANSDIDGDGIDDYLDLDVDNDGYPDILEAGGTDSDGDGIVNNNLNSDAISDGDNVPDNVDVDNFADNGGTGVDSDGDEIDDNFDVDQTGGTDTDGDGIDDTFDTDADGNGYDDAVEATPYGQEDKEGDGNKDFRDMDSDGDGIPDVTEFGETVNTANAQISGFTDSNSNGWNDTQETTAINPPNTDGDGVNDYQDIDADNDGIPDNLEGQTKATYTGISNTDTDNDGLDDAYDPDNGGTLVSIPATDGGDADYLDTDADGDTVNDNVEGDNDNKSQFAGWDANTNGTFDDTGFNADTDNDGLLDIFDNNSSSTSANVIGSNSDGQDSDNDNIWDFQDTDDDGDGLLTSSQGGGNEDSDSDGDPTNDFDDDVNNIIPNYLYGNQDPDGDLVDNDVDADSDNDGLADTSEDGGTGIDPSGDIDNDGLLNYQDSDIDGDAIANTADTDGDGSGTNTTGFTDTNGDSVIDQFDKDLDGVPDFLDLDSDNDGIADIIELGLTDADEDGTLNEGGGITDLNGNGLNDTQDPACVGLQSGNAVAQNGTGTNGANALGNVPGTFAEVANGTFLDFDLGVTVPSGNTIVLSLNDGAAAINATVDITQSPDDVTYTNVLAYTATTGSETAPIGPASVNYVLNANARYIRVQENSGANRPMDIHLLSYSFTACSGGAAISVPDTDSDGIDDHLDLDSDNDGITDNVEAQLTASYTAPAAGDTDGDGILDVYDEDISAGNALLPIDTETTGTADYLNTDSDGDGVLDRVEAFDSNMDGFGSWDSDMDGLFNDAGFNTDTDNDGILLIFDTSSGLGTIANISGSNTDNQDTDGDTAQDWRDIDDDGDGSNTSTTGASGEDANNNGNWADDFTQGGGTVPNYLYNPDVDGDGVVDQTDLDSDQDGVLNTDEYAGVSYAVGGDVSSNAGNPFGDSDGDGIYNYLDTSDVNFTITDLNGDGIDDRVDQDRDGIPNFFDLDSDNDGIMDAIEANGGTVPTGFNTSTGRYGVDNSGGDDDDDDNDGLNDNIDGDSSGTPLANTDTDNGSIDTLADFLDLDSDNDGITDHVEGLTTLAFANPSGNDTDGDGLDDTFDADNGGTAVTPTNTDGTDNPDYRDTNSDNDLSNSLFIADFIEAFDANRNGFSELDSNSDGLLTDETGYNVDTDGDGLWDLFDSFSGRGTSNVLGSNADLQDTDGDGTLDFRDTDDDNDNITTTVEDVDDDGIWTNDKVQGGGATPDYLFFNDTDKDLIADGIDVDGDNDGIPDASEYDNSDPNPFGDADTDGVFNYNDPDNPGGLTDSNADGIWDEYDLDLDGVPNFFDLDSDNDGITDLVEAGGTDADGDGKIDGIVDSDNDGLLDTYDVDATGGADVDLDGIDDAFDVSVLGSGTDADGDDVLDTVDRDDDGDGVIDTIDPDEGGTALTIPDTDSDTIIDMWDLDSDNDGIVDLVEGGGSDSNGDGQLDGFGDTDGDGLGNTVDVDNGGTALTLPDRDGTGGANYLDQDSDGDGTLDYDEGFDDDEDGDATSAGEDYEARATAYGNALEYDPADLSWLTDFRTFGSPNYYDADGDGIINLFDTDAGGNFYGNVSGTPDNDDDATENYVDVNDASSLPLDFLSFTGNYDNGAVYLEWVTTNEVNVSHFEIEHSTDGETFNEIGNLNAVNIESLINTYNFTHTRPINGFNYYRITEIDFDGLFESSDVVVVLGDDDELRFDLYPNPLRDVINIRPTANIPVILLKIVNLNGATVYQNTLRDTDGNFGKQIDLSNLNTGMYQLLMQVEGKQYQYKIIKQ